MSDLDNVYNFQPNSEEERKFVEMHTANSIRVSEFLRNQPKEKRLPALKEIDPSDPSLMGIYLWALRHEHYEACEAAKELLLERGYTAIPS